MNSFYEEFARYGSLATSPAQAPPIDFHAPNRHRTPSNLHCTKLKGSEGNGQPGELRIRQDPTPAQRDAEHERLLAAGMAARLHPAPPRPEGRPRLDRPASSKKTLWYG